MEMVDSDSIKQFLALNSKTTLELQAICEGFNLSTEGSKEELVQKLIGQNQVIKPVFPCLIPLRTTNQEGQVLPIAKETMLSWRKSIFNAQKRAEFQVRNSAGQVYNTQLRYIRIGEETLKKVLANGWYVSYSHNQEILSLVEQEPSKYFSAVVLKQYKDHSTWLMLYLKPKKAG